MLSDFAARDSDSICLGICLTAAETADYSALMEAELRQLEARIVALIQLSEGLRVDNQQLNAQVLALQVDNARLAHKVVRTTERISALLGSLSGEVI